MVHYTYTYIYKRVKNRKEKFDPLAAGPSICHLSPVTCHARGAGGGGASRGGTTMIITGAC